MYKIHDVCVLLGISKSTLIRWENSDKIPSSTRSLVGNRSYSIEDIKSIIRVLDSAQRLSAKQHIMQNIATHDVAIKILEELLAEL